MKIWFSLLIMIPGIALAAQNYPLEWSYQGNTGPQFWGTLSKVYRSCGEGKLQSPINIDSKNVVTGNGQLSIHYGLSQAKIHRQQNNIDLVFDTQKNTVSYHNDHYYLTSMHFHIPSEHTVNNKHYPLVAHLVNTNASGKLLVLGIMFDTTQSPNPFLRSLLSLQLPRYQDSHKLGRMQINPAEIIPNPQNFYTYSGSLTTPPCTEAVTWIVFSQPIHATAAQIKTLKERTVIAQARPVQPLNGRKVASVAQ